MNCGVGTRHRGAGRPDVRQRSGLRPELRCRVTISGVGLIRVVEYLSLFGSFRKIGVLYLWVLIIRILLFRVPY